MDRIEIVPVDKAIIDVIINQLDLIYKKLNQKNDIDDELLTVEQAVKLTKYEEQTLYKLIKTGKINNYGIGRSKRVNKQELLECLRSNVRL